MNAQKKIPDLPNSDNEFWDGEKLIHNPKSVYVCSTHSKSNYMTHTGYINRHDGTVMCKFCPWGAILSGNLRVENGRLIDVDLLIENSQSS